VPLHALGARLDHHAPASASKIPGRYGSVLNASAVVVVSVFTSDCAHARVAAMPSFLGRWSHDSVGGRKDNKVLLLSARYLAPRDK
jgi:hypothetical protein